ncbi:MAG: DUF349 domain-containing protein [Cryomorphaceae bacterium]|jgi:hypothetical protein|nr:DUF349 domain-containing protein [Cryomorphaceae bacterium]MBT3689713.1 DUF349 domain-containing protein [Cryomorphaceae bacterium]MBT4222700.1 DUF349 domain-containing protein [Cryomorphaceae bacterium]MBT4293195.1 DUF349 domain-containing protein [Cryomorphaceae bacterium]MBT4517471.1 DUF349 domain-containing protein [Cryomorphaceae bacterium]
MKDSNKKSKKSSSDSESPVKNIVPEMPKDKRTKAYKDWVKKYGEQSSDSTIIPEMPKDKRTKAYKDWVKQYGSEESPSKKSSKKDGTKKTKSTEPKKTKAKAKNTKVNLEDLVTSFIDFINSDNWFHKRKEIEDLRSKINLSLKKIDSDSEESKTLKSTFFQTLKNYSYKKRKYFSELSSNQKQNLEKRQGLIEKIKDLIVVDENSNKLYSKFKILKEEWHNTGQVPITERNNIWETYRHHVEKFYDFLHLNRDLRDLDYKHNYEEKLKIIERAEKLDEINDIVKASRDLNDLHRLWKNELGPVAREHSNDLWSRFQAASHKIHSKRQNFQKEISNVQQVNFEKKQNVIVKMRELTSSNPTSHSEWQNKIRDFEKLKTEFQNIKNLQRNKNKKSWNDFRITTKNFNTVKNDFYKNQKRELKKSIDIKKALIEEVKNIIEKNKISENSGRVKLIQEEWKKAGYLPRKISNSLWDEFKPIVNRYYDILKSGAINVNVDEQKTYDKRSKFIDKIKFSKKKFSLDEVRETFNALILKWNEMEEVNKNSFNILNNNLLKRISSIIKSLDIETNEKNNLIFDFELELSKANSEEINKKIHFIKRKISDLEDESIQFQNNLEFFSSSSSDNPLFKNVSTKIESINEKVEFWRGRLRKIKKVSITIS